MEIAVRWSAGYTGSVAGGSDMRVDVVEYSVVVLVLGRLRKRCRPPLGRSRYYHPLDILKLRPMRVYDSVYNLNQEGAEEHTTVSADAPSLEGA